MISNNPSEIARLRQQIETECVAMHRMMEYASLASHATISYRYKNLDRLGAQLEQHVPQSEAIDIIVSAYNATFDKPRERY